MKKLLYLLSVLVATSAFGADAANDFIFTQRKTDNSGNIQRNIPASGAATTAATFRSTLAIAGLTDDNTFTGTNTFSKAISVNDGTGKAGALLLAAGTTQSTTSSYITIQAPAAVTAYVRTLGGTVGSTGFPLYSVSGTTQTESLVAGTGTGSVVRAASPSLTGSIGINAASPQQMLHLAGTANVNTLFEQVSADASGGGLLGIKARGTPGTPDFPSAADVLLTLGGGGWNGTTLYNYNKAAILLRAYNTWVAGGTPDNSTDISFGTTPSGSTTRSEVFRMSNVSIQAFSPFIATPTARTTLALPYFTINTPADTGITASTEGAGIKVVTGTRTWATTGTVALQREVFFAGPTYASASASQTFTDAFNVYITPPVAGTNAIFTRGHSLGIVDSTSASSSITGGLVVATTLGTSATSVGIGGGNVNAGAAITAGSTVTAGTGLTVTSGASSLKQTTVAGAAATTALTITQTARTSGVLPYIKWTIPTDTGQTAATESPGVQVVTGTRTWATTGTVALQREVFFAGPTYASASASQTFTDAFNVYITPPVAGTNAIFTRGHSLGIVDSTSASSSITGGLVVATTLGTSATSVGIGGGNINAGGTITAGGNITGTVLGARAANLGTFASPNTAAGAITWTSPVYNIYTSAGSTRTYTLPAASSYTGQAFILNVAVGTGHVNVQPASGAQLVLAGVLLTADHYVQAATSAPGNYICFISDGTNWCSLGSSGTWADAASP